MSCASLLCFCETWLSPTQQIPSIHDSHVSLRCDRITPNNKGGVLISADQNLNPHETVTFTNTGVEGVITKLVLPNSQQLQLILLYRSPSIPVDSFVNVLTSLLSRIQVDTIPTIVMGDMNDCLLNKLNSKVNNVMSSSGFTQLVQSPTTDYGSLIDHVYYNGTLDGVIAEVSDTYYSDHDTVFVSIPISTEGKSITIKNNVLIPLCLSEVNKNTAKESNVHVSLLPNPTVKCLSSEVDKCKSNVDAPSIHTITWPQFRFYHVGEEWQRLWCSTLDIPYCTTHRRPEGSCSTMLTKPDMHSVKVMMGDGNCLFRSLSCILTGSQQHHLLVRACICDHMHSIIHLLLPHIYPHGCVENYIAHTKMNCNNVWGTDIEIFTFANMCQTNVYVFSIAQSNWNIFPPSLSVCDIDVSTKSVYLLHPSGHYDVITSICD